MCGDAMNYQCGNGRKTQQNEFRAISNFSNLATKNDENQNSNDINAQQQQANVTIKKLACGFGHTLCLLANNESYGWGLANYGALGPINSNTSIKHNGIQKIIQTPALLSYLL